MVVALSLTNGDTADDFSEALWASLMRTMDSGGMGGDEGWGFRAVMFAVTIGGVFIFSALIGVLTSGLESRLEGLRKGRSPVVESGHTLIHVRDIARKRGSSFSLTSQILDIRNRALAEAAEADDFIVSDRILSLIAAQLSENPGLGPVLDDIFDPEGSEIYIKSAADYVRLGVGVDFYAVTESCARRGQCAIGYRVASKALDAETGYGVVVNPRKSERIVFEEGDGIVVLADE